MLGFPFKSVFVLAGGVAGAPDALSHRVLVKLTTDERRGRLGRGDADAALDLRDHRDDRQHAYGATSRRRCSASPVWNLDALHRAMDRAIAPGVTTGSPLAEVGASTSPRTTPGACARRAGSPAARRPPARDVRPELDGLGAAAGRRRARRRRRARSRLHDVRRKIGMHGEAGDLDLRAARTRAPPASACAGRREPRLPASTPRCARRAVSPSSTSRCSSSR